MASRPTIVAANWKMFKSGDQGTAFAGEFLAAGPWNAGARVLVFPPFTALAQVAAAFRGSPVGVGAQTCSEEAEGAFTGEVSVGMISAAGGGHVLVGHSERRRLFGETDARVRAKTGAALAGGLVPVVCVGETLEEREAGRTDVVVGGQLDRALEGLPEADLRRLVLAYEPVWAIGTGRTATPAQAQEVHAFIRSRLKTRAVDGVVPVLYGGSVKPDNVSAIMACPDVDGALVGGASLDPKAFAALAKAARRPA